MEITSMTELEKRTLAEISEVIYGEELTRIMLPELKEYLNSYSSIERDEIAERKRFERGVEGVRSCWPLRS
jgi:effector-binding domain-containing protein